MTSLGSPDRDDHRAAYIVYLEGRLEAAPVFVAAANEARGKAGSWPVSGEQLALEAAPYAYAVIRVIPRVERGECLNAGVILFCRPRRFLDARVHLDDVRLAALAPGFDP